MLAELGGLALGTALAQGVTAISSVNKPKEIKVKMHKKALAGSLILGCASWATAAICGKIAES